MGRQSRHTVILSLCRDFTPSPWFCVTGVIIGSLCASWAFKNGKMYSVLLIKHSEVDKQRVLYNQGRCLCKDFGCLMHSKPEHWLAAVSLTPAQIANLSTRRLRHTNKLSEKLTRTFSHWESDFHIRTFSTSVWSRHSLLDCNLLGLYTIQPVHGSYVSQRQSYNATT